MKREYDPGKNVDPTNTPAHPKRATIGFLAYAINDDVNGPRWHGVVDAAHAYDVNLISVNGGLYHFTPETFEPANLLHDLLSPDALDAVIVGSIVREDTSSASEMRRFYQKLPEQIVSLRPVLPEIPHIAVNNYEGMRKAVEHLVTVHQCRRIAFLRGPADHPYAEDRYRAYLDVLEEHGLSVDPALVTPSNDWAVPSIKILLDERKLCPGRDFDAVAAVSDTVKGLSSIEILTERGFRVPEDVAVVSFDDVWKARLRVPPLTSVRLPFYEQGEQAMKLLLDRLRGAPLSSVAPPTSQLIVRRSCGCKEPSVAYAYAAMPAEYTDEPTGTALRSRWDDILDEMGNAVDRTETIQPLLERLLHAFLDDLQGEAPETFLEAWNDVLSQILDSTGNVAEWQDVLSALRRKALAYVTSHTVRFQAENLWGQARVVIGEYIQREQERRRFWSAQQSRIVWDIERAMMTTFELRALMDVLARELPRLGIPACYLALYESSGETSALSSSRPRVPEWGRLILAYTEQGRIELEAEGRRFPISRFIPSDLLPQDRSWRLHMEALDFQDRPLGFVLFEVGPREAEIYGALRSQISIAIQGALLVQRVQERSAELRRQQYILETFMANVPDSIYFKDRESRITNTNAAYAKRLGFTDSSEMIGKTDFDFFPEDQAHLKYKQEQEIMRSGQPLPELEEPKISGGWALTTKMPLRDEHGNTIGTFGISRDITALKKTQAALEQAYAEVEQRVRERTAELSREITQRIHAEEEIRNLNAELEERVKIRTAKLEAVNKELKDFAHVVSHDLKAPLRGIARLASWLSDDYRALFDEAGQEKVSLLIESVKHLDKLIDGILQYSRLGQLSTEEESIDLRDLIQTVIERLILPEHIQVTLEGRFPNVHYNRSRMLQLFQNLLSNAVKFLDKPQGDIRIACHEEEEQWIFSVADNGPGIEEQDREKIFMLFRTLPFQSQEKSTGIGLAIVKKIVDVYGGKIWVESTIGEGSTFWFTLPRKSY